jgi:hypothetical protein
MNLFGLSKEDVAWIRDNIDELKNVVSNRSRPGMENSWAEAEDHQAPEVYIAYPQDDPDEDAQGGTGTGTFWKRNPSISIPGIVRATSVGEYDVISSAKCDLYRIVKNTVSGEDELKPVCGTTNKEACFRRVYNASDQSIVDSYLLAIRDKYGRFMAIQGASGLVKCMLAEDHPGRHTPGATSYEFKVWPGKWCPNQRAWMFDCEDESETWDAVDSFYGGSNFTYPDKYSQIWTVIKPAPGCRDDIVYDAVTGDCDSDNDCETWELPCTDATGTGS